ncbi:MAG TPA: FAD:protein FMN transferase [Thermomicrobiaceae bacterium]|nr:FAD:protein FMN transferase [Thermomicrobiaceae bacterium]
MTGSMESYRHTFHTMGTSVEMLLVGSAEAEPESVAAFALARVLANEWERTFSRFRSDSEISRLNARAEELVAVSERLYAAIEIALEGSRLTGGIFDATVLPALLALGYDRTFKDIHDDGGQLAPARAPGIAGICLDPEHRRVSLPSGTQLDLSGVVKGLYVDLLAGMGGWQGGAISAGGDLRVWGTPPEGDRWIIGVEDPDNLNRDSALLRLDSGAVATSGTNRRNWRRAGRPVHHLVDPRTGLSARSGVRSVSVVSATGVQAEIAATAIAVGGLDARFERSLFRRAVVILDDGEQISIRGSLGGQADVDNVAVHAAAV